MNVLSPLNNGTYIVFEKYDVVNNFKIIFNDIGMIKITQNFTPIISLLLTDRYNVGVLDKSKLSIF